MSMDLSTFAEESKRNCMPRASHNPAKMMGKYHDYELNFTNIGHEESLAVRNIKWRVRTFFGIRLGH